MPININFQPLAEIPAKIRARKIEKEREEYKRQQDQLEREMKNKAMANEFATKMGMSEDTFSKGEKAYLKYGDEWTGGTPAEYANVPYMLASNESLTKSGYQNKLLGDFNIGDTDLANKMVKVETKPAVEYNPDEYNAYKLFKGILGQREAKTDYMKGITDTQKSRSDVSSQKIDIEREKLRERQRTTDLNLIYNKIKLGQDLTFDDLKILKQFGYNNKDEFIKKYNLNSKTNNKMINPFAK